MRRRAHAAQKRTPICSIYVAVTIGFNLVVSRLPGAGESYLDAAVPALALVAGAGGAAVFRLARDWRHITMLATAASAIHLAGTAPSAYRPWRPNAARLANAYVVAHSTPANGVLAETVAIEFYSGRPVRAIAFTHPRELVLRSLQGTSGDDISFVVVRDGVSAQHVTSLQAHWDRLLAAHFKRVWSAAGLSVCQRARVTQN